MNRQFKLFALLWLLGLIGEVTLLGADLPLPPGPLPLPLSTIRGLMLLQGMVLLTIAVALGVVLAPRVQLAAPWLAAIAQGMPLSQRALKPPLVWGAIGGLVSASLALLWLAGWQPALPPEFLTAAKTYQLPLFARILRGGMSEEILMRWGLMTLVVWLPWRIAQRQRDLPLHPGYYVAALGLTAVIFGVLHLPLAFLLSPTITISLVVYIIGANAIVGAIAGYLYWQWGLEAAIIAHALFHVCVAVAETLG